MSRIAALALMLAVAADALPAEPPMEITNSIGMKFRLISAGEFLMGAPESDASASSGEKPQHQVQITDPPPDIILYSDASRNGKPQHKGRKTNPAGAFWVPNPEAPHNGEPQHKVRITKPFYLGMYEVTQAEYEKVMGKNPSGFLKGGKYAKRVSGKDTSGYPVEHVSWDDAVEFCKKLSAKEGKNYRLPTEAEWEYACRAGTTTKWCCGDKEDELMRVAWCGHNSGASTHPVGTKEANAWGLFDMHGNVWEWCQDWYGDYSSNEATDPTGPPEGSYRVNRGGAWPFIGWFCQSSYRFGGPPTGGGSVFGFRVVLVPSTSPDKPSK